MAVGPVLPWRAASGETAARPAARPGVGRRRSRSSSCVLAGARGIADVFAFALGAFVLASIGRSVIVGVRARRRVDARGGTGRDRTARCAATRGCTAGCSCTSAWSSSRSRSRPPSGYTTKREVQLSPGQSATVRGLHGHVPAHHDRGERAEDDDHGGGRRPARVELVGDARDPRSRPTRTSRRASARPRSTATRGTTCTSRSCRRPRRARRAARSRSACRSARS